MTTITKFILNETEKVDTSAHKFSLAYVPMKTGQYISDPLEAAMPSLLGSAFLLGYLIPLIIFTAFIAEEKEKKLKAILKMMGLRESTYVVSWMLFYLLICVINAIITLVSFSFNVMSHSTAGLIFLFLFLYGLS